MTRYRLELFPHNSHSVGAIPSMHLLYLYKGIDGIWCGKFIQVSLAWMPAYVIFMHFTVWYFNIKVSEWVFNTSLDCNTISLANSSQMANNFFKQDKLTITMHSCIKYFTLTTHSQFDNARLQKYIKLNVLKTLPMQLYYCV